MQINIIVEPSFYGTYWCSQYLEGIYSEVKKYGYSIKFVSSCDQEAIHSLGDNGRRLVLLIGTSPDWVVNTVSFFSRYDFHCIVMPYPVNHPLINVSLISTNYSQSIHSLIDYLRSVNRDKIALFGISSQSATDQIKKDAYCSYIKNSTHEHDGVFWNNKSLNDSCENFCAVRDKFNSIICANDAAAMVLLRFFRKHGINVPEQYFLVSFGDMLLGQICRPSLTIAKLHCVEAGEKAVQIYNILKTIR